MTTLLQSSQPKTMPPRGRPKRNTKKVDYSKFADPTAEEENSGEDFDEKDVAMADVASDQDEDMDEAAEVESQEDDSIEITVEEEEEVPKRTPKKKTASTAKKTKKEPKKAKKEPKTPKKKKETKPKKTATSSLRKEVRVTKLITSIKDRLIRLYGSNEDKLVELVRNRRLWENELFTFDDELLQDELEFEEADLPFIESNTLSLKELNSKFPIVSDPKNFQYEDQDIDILETGESIKHKNSIFLNTGGLISDVAWLSRSGSEDQILAVSLLNITNNANAKELSLLSKSSFPGLIQLYSFNSETHGIKLIKSLLHNWGGAWDLKQAPISTNNNEVIMSGVFNDGSVRVLKINIEDSIEFLEITKPSIEFSVPNNQISTYDWVNQKIIVGTSNGSIAEFVLDPSDTSPSYVYPLHSGYIYSIAAAISAYEDPILYCTCSDGSSALFSPTDLVSSINKTPKSRSILKTVIYSPQTYSFVHLEGPYTTKAVPVGALFGSVSVSKHDGSAESIATSRLHPLVISGGSDGLLQISNMVRKLLNSHKNLASGHKILKLFQLQYGANENTFRFIRPLKVETLPPNDNVEVANVYPPEVSINSLSWNESRKGGKWFTAGTTSGLLILQSI